MAELTEFRVEAGLISGLVTFLIATAFVYFAARIVIDRSSLLASALTALVATFLATLVWSAVDGTLGLVLGIAVWAVVAALFFRTRWVKGALIGVVAWLLWVLVTLGVRALRQM